MKYQIIIYLCLIGNISLAQQKKPLSPKKPTTTLKTNPAKIATKKTVIQKPSTTTTSPSPPNSIKVGEKKPEKSILPKGSPSEIEIPNEQPSSTVIQQSSGRIKGNKLEEGMKRLKSKRIKTPRIPIEENEIKFGIRAEGTQSFTFEKNVSTDLSPGINIGFLINLPINKTVSIQPEILYSIFTIKASEDENNYVKNSIGKILMPLMFNFNFGKSTTKFMLNLGGYANYGLSQNTKVISLGKTVKDGSVVLGNDRFDYGLGIGVGVKLNDKLMIEARSFYGMKNNINKNGFGTIGMGYLF